MNDKDRAELVENDEGLYNLFRGARPRQSLTKWVRENRALIDGVVDNVQSLKKPQHYLAYERPSGTQIANHRSPFGMFG